MKVKNIMFSGFAAAILMGVGAAHAVVANPVTLADQGYVDAKVAAVAGQKEAVANKMNATTAGATDLDVLAADEANYPSVAAAVQIAGKKASEVITEVNQVAGNLTDLTNKVNGLVTKVNTEGNVAEAIAGALTEAKGYADGLAANYDEAGAAAQALVDAKADTAAQIAALDLANKYDAKGAAAAAETAAKAYADGLAANYDEAGAAAAAETAAKAYADGLATNYDAAGAAAAAETAAKAYADGLATNYETAGAAAAAETAAKAYTDTKVGEVDVKVTANTNAITTLNGDGDGSVKKMAADAATAAVNASGHATQEALQAEIDRATAAEAANAADIEALETGKLDVVESAGTYMVTRDAEGNISYTKVKVATGVAENGDAVVTE